jgi:hypothetical protein
MEFGYVILCTRKSFTCPLNYNKEIETKCFNDDFENKNIHMKKDALPIRIQLFFYIIS